MSGLYSQGFSPARTASPQIRGNPDHDRLLCSQYLAELLAEHQKLGPFMQVLPVCSRLLNQEIMRVSSMAHDHGFSDFDRRRYRSPSPMSSPIMRPNLHGNGFGPWNGLHQERVGFPPPGTSMDWQGAPPSPGSYIVKKIVRMEVPVDAYPNFNFVGRILGPRGNSLKRVEASSGCRVFIRGKGSIKDTDKEEKLKGKPGYEHLNDPLHVLIEAELPANIIDARLRQAQEIMEELLRPVQQAKQERDNNEGLVRNEDERESTGHRSMAPKRRLALVAGDGDSVASRGKCLRVAGREPSSLGRRRLRRIGFVILCIIRLCRGYSYEPLNISQMQIRRVVREEVRRGFEPLYKFYSLLFSKLESLEERLEERFQEITYKDHVTSSSQLTHDNHQRLMKRQI